VWLTELERIGWYTMRTRSTGLGSTELVQEFRYMKPMGNCLVIGLETVEPMNIILANLPYVSDAELSVLSPEIKNFESRVALAGGADGLDKIRQLLPQAKQKYPPLRAWFCWRSVMVRVQQPLL
jgi:hypothetical protein